jgi:hypothetical protein
MNRYLAVLIFGAVFGGSSLVACSCVSAVRPGPCGILASPPVKGSISSVGTVTGAEHAGVLGRGADDVSPLAHYHFHVDELIAGVGDVSTIEIVSTRGGGDCSAHFRLGTQYLINAYQLENGTWSTSICSGNRLASEASLFLQQLRAKRKGEKLPSLYGRLRQRQEPYGSVQSPDYERGLGSIRIRLRDGERSFESITDSEGQYMVYDVPQGKYRIEADLPPGLELAQTILRDPPPPIELAGGACLEHEMTALPKATITGHVIYDSGKPADLARVALYREELYGKPTSLPWSELQQGSKPFVFAHIAAGSYILVFNERDEKNPDAPFGRTFFGDVPDLAHAKRLVVSEADGVITADIRVHGATETRKIRVSVFGEDGKPAAEAHLSLSPSAGFPLPKGDGVFTVNLFKQTAYEITAKSFCISDAGGLSTAKVSAQIVDDDTTELTLVIPGPPCPKRKSP